MSLIFKEDNVILLFPLFVLKGREIYTPVLTWEKGLFNQRLTINFMIFKLKAKRRYSA